MLLIIKEHEILRKKCICLHAKIGGFNGAAKEECPPPQSNFFHFLMQFTAKILPDNRFLSEIQALRLRQGNHGPIIAKLVKIADSPFCLSVCAACYKQVHIIFLLFSLEFSVVNY